MAQSQEILTVLRTSLFSCTQTTHHIPFSTKNIPHSLDNIAALAPNSADILHWIAYLTRCPFQKNRLLQKSVKLCLLCFSQLCFCRIKFYSLQIVFNIYVIASKQRGKINLLPQFHFKLRLCQSCDISKI